ncbi:MAG: MarR family transcriptional regulator [Proteobacteria bacterium]|nr:MarR family transcriptional regulator [Pseudomonadota bacterium]
MPGITAVDRLGKQYLEKELAKEGITLSEFRIVGTLLGSTEGLNQKEIARRLSIRPASLSTAIDKLEGKGVVRRFTDPNDSRGRKISIAENIPIEKITEIVQILEKKAAGDIDPEKLKITRAVMADMKENLTSFLEASEK